MLKEKISQDVLLFGSSKVEFYIVGKFRLEIHNINECTRSDNEVLARWWKILKSQGRGVEVRFHILKIKSEIANVAQVDIEKTEGHLKLFTKGRIQPENSFGFLSR